MNLTEFKKELSALSGVDFFNPKYRNVFKKYCPNAATDNEEERLNEVLGEDNESSTETTDAVETQEEKSTEKQTDLQTENEESSSDEEQEQNEEQIETSSSSETEENSEDENSDSEEKTETEESDSSSESEETETSEDDKQTETSPETDNDNSETTNAENSSNELLEAKVELQLVRSGVRDDRINPAKKLFMPEIKTLEDLDKLKELIKQYPEWLKENKTNPKGFGMPLGDRDEVLTEEEKRLQELGINPRD